MMRIWMKVTKDKYELPLIVADTAEELAQKCGTSANNIRSTVSHAAKQNFRSGFVKVECEEGD